MKKKFLCSTLAMAMAASMLFGCASESKTETTAAAGETTAAADETTAEAAKAETNGEKLKVTLLVTGSFGDKAFNDSAQAGMEKLEAELGDKVEVNMVEMGSDKTKFEGSMLDACESDADLIITGLWDMKEITEKVAQEFPEKKFIIFDTDVDYTIGDLSNVYSMSYKQNEGAFLAGVLAASATKSDMEYANEDNVIGFVGAKDTAAVINDSAVGFIEGAQFVDPDVKVLVSYVGSYVDSATAKELAITQYSNGADVVFVAAGPLSRQLQKARSTASALTLTRHLLTRARMRQTSSSLPQSRALATASTMQLRRQLTEHFRTVSTRSSALRTAL